MSKADTLLRWRLRATTAAHGPRVGSQCQQYAPARKARAKRAQRPKAPPPSWVLAAAPAPRGGRLWLAVAKPDGGLTPVRPLPKTYAKPDAEQWVVLAKISEESVEAVARMFPVPDHDWTEYVDQKIKEYQADGRVAAYDALDG